MTDLKLVSGEQLDRFTEKISKPIKNISTELENLKTDLSDCVGYRKFSGEWITAQHTLEDKTRNLAIEGNSIVNLASGLRSTELGVLAGNVFTVTATGGRRGNLYFDNAKGQIENKETYTIIMNITKNTLVGNTSSFKFNLNNYSIENYGYFKVENGFTGIHMKVIRTATTTVIDTPYLETYTNQTSGELEISNIYILKGDWSNKTIPNYFEGLKSVGDLQVDGLYKVDVLSKNKSLCNTDKKQILLQEPLHKINDNIKDTIAFIDGKWKIKRMCHFKAFDKNSPFSIVGANSKFAEFILDTDRYKSNADFALKSNLFLDKVAIGSEAVKNPIGIGVTTHNALRLRPVDNDNLTEKDVTDWFGDKTLELLYELETPFYEDIEQDISVYTYDKLTHVYADTIIPPNLSFSSLVDLGNTINGLESTNTANLKLIEDQENRLIEQAYSILDNDIRLCILELGL